MTIPSASFCFGITPAHAMSTYMHVLLFPTGSLTYNAQSPDEAALVAAAKNFGYVFKVCILVETLC